MANVKLNTNNSVVDYLKSQGKDSSYSNRSKLANQYGIKNYTGSGDQNNQLLSILKSGQSTNQAQAKNTTTAKKPVTTNQATTKANTTKATPSVTAAVQTTVPISNVLSNAGTSPSYEANQPSAYQSAYSDQINSLIDSILNRGNFTYDAASDPTYQTYKEQYTKQANLGLRDTMGNAAALTGGYGNSYATTAGQQTYDSYMTELNNMIPELYDAAYQKYQNELNNDYNALSTLQNIENQDYNKYRDSISDYQTNRSYYYNKDYDTQQQNNWQTQYDRGVLENDRAYDYQVDRDAVSDGQWQTQYDRGVLESDRTYNYQVDRDKVEDNQWNQTFNYQKSRDSIEDSQWSQSFNYRKQQDAIDRADAMDRYLAELEASKSTSAAGASEKRINKYTNEVDKLLTTEDMETQQDRTVKLNKAWNFLSGSSLDDSEISVILDGNYELRNYVEGMQSIKESSVLNKTNTYLR